MEIAQKTKILKSLDTKDLITKLTQYEDGLEKVLMEQMQYSSQNHSFIVSRGNDCQEVKRILAELSMQAPLKEEGKKFTVADRENWLILQRKENKELSAAIVKQREVAFLLDDYQVKVEMAKKRAEGIKAVIALKTAQINFLAS
ncbi:hypothetical protein ES703_82527 [subsurface metagenome]